MPDYITLPEQRVPVIAECDVLVVGGGAAGMSAAIAARAPGRRRRSSSSATATSAASRPAASSSCCSRSTTATATRSSPASARSWSSGCEARNACFYPPKDEWGNYDDALVEKYRRWGLVWGSGPHRVRYSVAYDPEEFKFIANTWVAEAGVRLMYHRWATDVVRDGDAHHARRLHVEGRPAGRSRASHVIDATGDGDVFTMAGEAFEKEQIHPWLWFRMSGVRDVDAAQAARGGFFFRTVQPGQVLMPWGAAERIARRIDATNPDDLTFAEVECRRMVMDEVDRLRAQVPGFEDAYLTDVALTLGVTESRRLARRSTRSPATTSARVFDDTIATTGHWTKYGAVYHIPYRSLLPQRTPNLLVAGRCISVDHRVHHATKEIPPAFATGEAAGIAAAHALRASSAVQDVDVGALQSALRAAGAWLPR